MLPHSSWKLSNWSLEWKQHQECQEAGQHGYNDGVDGEMGDRAIGCVRGSDVPAAADAKDGRSSGSCEMKL